MACSRARAATPRAPPGSAGPQPPDTNGRTRRAEGRPRKVPCGPGGAPADVGRFTVGPIPPSKVPGEKQKVKVKVRLKCDRCKVKVGRLKVKVKVGFDVFWSFLNSFPIASFAIVVCCIVLFFVSVYFFC